MTDKAALRVQARAVRRRLAETRLDAPQRLASHADDLLDALSGRGLMVALYRAQGSEIDPAPLARALIALSCDLCLPVVVRRDAPLIFRRWAPGDALSPDLVGAAAPLAEAPEVDPGLILCPLLAFDSAGGRLGQGGGYYDRTLAERPGAAFVGLAYAGQAVDRLPMDAHDVPLDGVLTEVGYQSCIWH